MHLGLYTTTAAYCTRACSLLGELKDLAGVYSTSEAHAIAIRCAKYLLSCAARRVWRLRLVLFYGCGSPPGMPGERDKQKLHATEKTKTDISSDIQGRRLSAKRPKSLHLRLETGRIALEGTFQDEYPCKAPLITRVEGARHPHHASMLAHTRQRLLVVVDLEDVEPLDHAGRHREGPHELPPAYGTRLAALHL